MSMRVTLKQVALAAKVHHTTVSRALRGHHSIPKETQDRVRQIAAKLGYRPDAMLSSLIAYRQQIHRPKYNATLAWVTNHPTREGWKEQGKIAPPYQGAVSAIYRDAAEERANELGYKLETFWMREPNLNPKRLSSILHARNINGLLLAPQPRARSHTHLEWDRFSVVGLGFSLYYPAFNIVGNNHFHSMVTIMRELKGRGYRRIGLCLFFDVDERVDNNYRAVYQFRTQSLPPSERIPYFWSRNITQSVGKAFDAWFKRFQPDAIISCNWEVHLWLLNRGIKVPEDVGLVLTSTAHPRAICSGIYDHPDRVGRMAVDHLVGMIQREERGIPELPCRLEVEGSWCEGQTVRPRLWHEGKSTVEWSNRQQALRDLPIPSSAKFEPHLPNVKQWLAGLPPR
ncbi:MAG: hypothetical protein B9S32_01885 [Verrucomicrobia bacterium Tous-C9LFEB]|nr:MAG: hypothetical protein B9S32_01885 [Verrucomicrobia bacterium Tous-C9LFEB]